MALLVAPSLWIPVLHPIVGQLRAVSACLWVGGFPLTLSVFLGFFFYRSRVCLWLGVVTIDNLPPWALVLLRVGGTPKIA